ncbi:MAG: DUF4836 family protein [Bacteroidetes bacterium]|jgi:uncharacterized protein YacL (UPF0231 family)|nr:DUF4836 family protein [Bacteroidota bacterium]MBK9300710.1 DUF4836 family protein [Bacteroidota bacterium]
MAFIVITVFSCNKIPNHAKYIPKNALGVFAIDMDKLSKKLIWNVLTGSEIFDEMQKDIKNEESKKAMKDFSNIGIDPATTLYIFYTGNMKDENHPCLLAGMKDVSKFESFLSKNYPAITVVDNKEFKSCLIESKFILSWNKEAAIATMINNRFSYETDSTGAEIVVPDMVNEEKDKNYLKELFALNSTNAITSNDNFKKLQNDGHDFSLWVNYEELYKQNKDLNTAELKAFIKDDYFRDAALATGFDFEKGAVDMEMDYYFSKELAAIYKKYSNENMDEKLVNSIPSKDIDLLVAYNLKPKMIEDFLKEFKLDGLANLGLVAVGTSMETILSAFKGDMVFALTDMKLKTKDTTQNPDIYVSDMPDFNLTYAMNVNQLSSLQSLLDKGVSQSLLVKNGNTYSMPYSDEGALMFDKDKLVFSNQKTTAQAFMENKGNAKEGLPADVWKNIVNNPITMYANIKKMMSVIPMEATSEIEKQLLADLQSMFTYAQIYGGKMKGNANHLEGNLYFSNKEENAMIQLINLGIKMKKEQDSRNKNIIADTLAV